MIKFGINLSKELLEEPFNLEIREVLDMFSSLKVDNVEISLRTANVFSRKGDLDIKKVKEFKDLTSSYKFTYVVHAPFPYYAPTYLDLLHGKKHKRAIKILEESIKISSEIGAKVMVVHPSHTFGFHKEENEKKLIKKIIENLSLISKYLDKLEDIKLGLETMAPKKDRIVVGDYPKEIMNILTHLNSNRMGVTWDMCHTFKSMQKYNLKIKDFEGIAKNTCHVHHSDFTPLLNKCHCPEGYGKNKKNFVSLLKKYHYNGVVTSEMNPMLLIFLNPKKKIEDWFKEIIKNTKKIFSD